jgi:AraC-like DNA-binding protein
VLVQVGHQRIPGHDAYQRVAAIRGAGFAISILWTSGLATDWGVQSRFVEYIARQDRSQLSIVLAGRGYVTLPTGTVLLGPGDVVELDQRRHDDEGYGGTPCEVLVVDWDHDGPFGAERRGPPRCSRLSSHDTQELRALVARFSAAGVEPWVDELVLRLRALGLPAPRKFEVGRIVLPQAARIYEALGTARSQLEAPVSLTELADSLGLSERHLRRAFAHLEGLGMKSSGWRGFLGDIRLGWAQQLLSVPGLSMKRIAQLTGFGSDIAFSHSFSARAGTTPGAMARLLRERWR